MADLTKEEVLALATARALILRERIRQIEDEGWTAEHDDKHEDGEILRAATIYLWHGTDLEAPIQDNGAPLGWPWALEWWKPKSRQRNLERAGALYLAERCRLRRMGVYVGHIDHKLAIVERELAALVSPPATVAEAGAVVPENQAIRLAAEALVAARSSTYRARNGREVGVEDSSGEKVWLVSSDEMHNLEQALAAATPPPTREIGKANDG